MHWSEHADSQFGIRLNPRQLEAFDEYAAELQAWNRRFNLTSVTDRAQIQIKHFLDSLSCREVMRPRPGERKSQKRPSTPKSACPPKGKMIVTCGSCTLICSAEK